MISFKEYNSIEEAADAGLAAKSAKSGISIGTLRKVYNRGMAAWNSGHRPGTTPQQWGMARVNSYISKGSGTYGGADKDLHEELMSPSETYKKLAVKHLRDSMNKNNTQKQRDYAKTMNTRALEAAKKDNHTDALNHYRGVNEGDTSKLPRIDHDKETGLPKKYVAGLSKSTAKARAAHFAKADTLSDSDPEAYKPAPGDATAKTKLSKHTLKYREMFGEGMDEEVYEACWDSHKQVGLKKKGNKMVPNCVREEDELDEVSEQSLIAPSLMKHRISVTVSDPDHTMVSKRKEKTQKTVIVTHSSNKAGAQKVGEKFYKRKGYFVHDSNHAGMVSEELTADEQFDIIEEMVMAMASEYNADPESIWEKFEAVDDITLLEAAVDAKGYKSSTGGLTQKGRDAYNAKGANLQAPVTTPPSKLKAGSKAANRRKSFCARMGGMQGAMKKPNGEPTRKALALRKWNC